MKYEMFSLYGADPGRLTNMYQGLEEEKMSTVKNVPFF